MGKRGSKKRAPNLTGGSQASISLREESTGKKQTHVNAKSMLKLEHIKNLAVWASGEASIPSLGAYFGHRLASFGESIGTPTDPSLFSCQRCESILQPGQNCTVRIEKNGAKVKKCRRRKPTNSPQNNVVYKCHFCSHQNLKRGTPRGHMKDICPSKVKPTSKFPLPSSTVQKFVSSEKVAISSVEVSNINEVFSLAVASDDGITSSPATPLVRTGSSLLEGKKRKRNKSGAKKQVESESNSAEIDAEKAVSASSKRKRKSWTSLKEIAENSECDSSRNFTNLAVPFFI